MTRLADVRSETALIGMAIERPDNAATTCAALLADDFSNPHTKAAFVAIRDLTEAGDPLDLTEIAEQLKAKGNGWATATADLFRWQAEAPLSSDREIESRVVRLKNASTRRAAYLAAKSLMDKAEDGEAGDFESALGRLKSLQEATTQEGSRLVYKWASDVLPEKTRWLWKGWLVKGALHVLAGQQSAGKTTWVAYVNAQLMRGKLGDCEGLKVGYISLEESGDRLSGRLRVAGADPTKVAIYETVMDVDKTGAAFQRPWRLPQDTSLLANWIKELGLNLVIVDGLGYAVAGSQDYATIGSALSALAKVAETTDCSVLGLTHVKKGGTADAVTAAIGSTAWTAVPRIVWVLGLDPEDDTDRRRLVAVSKTNYKEPESGFAFTIANDEESEIGYVTNVETSSVSAHAIVAPREPFGDRSERSEARNLVAEILSGGWVETQTLLNQTQSAGLSDRTVKRARQDLGVVSRQRRNPATRKLEGWELSLPPSNGKKVGPLGPLGTLAATRTYTPESHSRSTGPLSLYRPENQSDDDFHGLDSDE